MFLSTVMFVLVYEILTKIFSEYTLVLPFSTEIETGILTLQTPHRLTTNLYNIFVLGAESPLKMYFQHYTPPF